MEVSKAIYFSSVYLKSNTNRLNGVSLGKRKSSTAYQSTERERAYVCMLHTYCFHFHVLYFSVVLLLLLLLHRLLSFRFSHNIAILLYMSVLLHIPDLRRKTWLNKCVLGLGVTHALTHPPYCLAQLVWQNRCVIV